MENKKKKKKLSNREFFVWNLGKNILFGIGNGAEFRPQNRVIKSPVIRLPLNEQTVLGLFHLHGAT